MAIDIKMDISDVIAKTQQLTQLGNAQSNVFKKMADETKTYNEAGTQTSQVIKEQINNVTQLVERTVGMEGQYKRVTRTIQATSDAVKALKQQQQDFKASPNLNQIDKLTFGSNVDVTKLEKIKSDIAKLNTILVSPQLIETYFNALKNGVKIEATGDLAKARDLLQKIQDLSKGPAPAPDKMNPKTGEPAVFDGSGLDRLTAYSGTLDKIKTSMLMIGAFQLFAAGKNAMGQAISDAREYQIQISLIRTLSQDAQLSTAQWSRELGNLSSYLGVDFKDAANAAYDAISNQIASGTKALEFVRKAGEFARVTNSTLKDSGNLFASIQNTYGDEAGNLDEIAAKLFKTIDRGRIVANELSNTFGRVAFSAKDVGLSFEEVTGALALLTRSGVTTDDAITLVNNLVQQVTKPSVELKKFFDEAGIGADRDAFKLKGLVGIVELFNKGIKEGKISAQEIFPEIRAQRAFSQFSARPKELQADIDYTGDAGGGTYARALEIRSESSADKLAKISKAFQNTLANSIGTNFNDVLLGSIERASNGFGAVARVFGSSVKNISFDKMTSDADAFAEATKRVEDVLNRAIRISVALAAGYAVVKTGLTALTIVQEVQLQAAYRRAAADALVAAQQTRNVVANTAEAASLARLQASKNAGTIGILSANPYVGAVIGLASLAAAYFAYKSAVVETNNEAAQSFEDLLKQLKKVEDAKVFEKQLDLIKELNKEFDKATKKVANDLGSALIINNGLLETTRTKSKAVGDELKSKFAGGLEIVRNKLQELNAEYATFDQRIKESVKSAAAFRDKLNDITFGTQQKYATPNQSIELDKNRIGSLLSQAKMLYAQGTDEAVKEARSLFDRVGQLQSDLFEKETKKRVDAAPNGSVITVDVNGLLSEQNKLVQLRDEYEASINARLLERKRIVETEVGKEKERVIKLEGALKKFEEFSILSTDGKVKREFQTPGGKIDIEKVKAAGEKVIADVLAQFPNDVAKRLDATGLILQKKNAIRDEVKQVQDKFSGERSQTDIVNKRKDLDDNTIKGTKAIEDYQKKLDNTIKTLKDLSENIANTAGAVPDKFRELEGNEPRTRGSRTLRRLGRNVVDAADSLNQATGEPAANTLNEGNLEQVKNLAKQFFNSLDQVRRDAENTSGKPGTGADALTKAVEDAEKLKKLLLDVIQNTSDVTGIKDKDKPIKPGEFNIPGTKLQVNDIDQVIESLKKVIKESKTDIEVINKTSAQGDKITELIQPLKEASDAYNKGAVAAGAASGGLALVFGNLGTSAAIAAAALRKVQSLDELNRNLESKKLGVQEVEPERKAYGGPIGYDNQIYKRNDEFVSSGAATTRYMSQLQSMNNESRVPDTFTNDNYSINVNESSTPQLTASAVMAMIARSKRQGL